MRSNATHSRTSRKVTILSLVARSSFLNPWIPIVLLFVGLACSLEQNLGTTTPGSLAGDTLDGQDETWAIAQSRFPAVNQTLQQMCRSANTRDESLSRPVLPQGCFWKNADDPESLDVWCVADRLLTAPGTACGDRARSGDCLFSITFLEYSRHRCAPSWHKELLVALRPEERGRWLRGELPLSLRDLCEETGSQRLWGGHWPQADWPCHLFPNLAE